MESKGKPDIPTGQAFGRSQLLSMAFYAICWTMLKQAAFYMLVQKRLQNLVVVQAVSSKVICDLKTLSSQ